MRVSDAHNGTPGEKYSPLSITYSTPPLDLFGKYDLNRMCLFITGYHTFHSIPGHSKASTLVLLGTGRSGAWSMIPYQ